MSRPNPFAVARTPFAGSTLPADAADTRLDLEETALQSDRAGREIDRPTRFLDRFTEDGRAVITTRRRTREAVADHRLRMLRTVHEVKETALKDYGNAVLRAQSTALEVEVQRVLLARYEEVRREMEQYSDQFHGWLTTAYERLDADGLPPNVAKSRLYELEAHLAEYHNVMNNVRARFTELSSARVG
ncbi:MAG: hypothetical protein AAGI91_15285 [Bacteroidota bacterium]